MVATCFSLDILASNTKSDFLIENQGVESTIASPLKHFLRYTVGMYYYIFGGVLLLLAIWTVGSYLAVRNLEEPAYTVLEKRKGYEIREYKPYIIAETTVTGDQRAGINQGFSIIAGYIFGDNTSKQKIPMTTPVLEEVGGGVSEKIAMTVPVIDTEAAENERTISFVLPSKYTLDTLPTPNDDRVKLVEVPAQKVAALRFTWYGTPARVESQKAKLQTMLIRDNLTTIGNLRTAFYNPPLSMPLILRNEILAPLQ